MSDSCVNGFLSDPEDNFQDSTYLRAMFHKEEYHIVKRNSAQNNFFSNDFAKFLKMATL